MFTRLFIQHGSGESGSVESPVFLVADEWFSVVLYSGIRESRRVGAVTHSIVRYGD